MISAEFGMKSYLIVRLRLALERRCKKAEAG